jgi:hypothetical protein
MIKGVTLSSQLGLNGLTTSLTRNRAAVTARTLNITMLKSDPRVVGSNLSRTNWLFRIKLYKIKELMFWNLQKL